MDQATSIQLSHHNNRFTTQENRIHIKCILMITIGHLRRVLAFALRSVLEAEFHRVIRTHDWPEPLPRLYFWRLDERTRVPRILGILWVFWLGDLVRVSNLLLCPQLEFEICAWAFEGGWNGLFSNVKMGKGTTPFVSENWGDSSTFPLRIHRTYCRGKMVLGCECVLSRYPSKVFC